jgi:hypothetical protein
MQETANDAFIFIESSAPNTVQKFPPFLIDILKAELFSLLLKQIEIYFINFHKEINRLFNNTYPSSCTG